MANVLQGIITDIGRETLAKSLGFIGFGFSTYIKYFKYGEGGFQIVSGSRVPKIPDPTRTFLEADDPGQPLADSLSFPKDLTPEDITFISPSTIEFRCKLSPSEANFDHVGASPKFFELGLFDVDDNMIAYATFDEQTKTATKALITYMQIVF